MTILNTRGTVIAFSVLSALSGPTSADDLKPFTSDGCSAFPDGTIQQKELWLDCCTAHDYAYWKGGTYQDRVDADIELKDCVAGVENNEIAHLMLAGVRVGGSPFLPTPFRWGYGWSYPKPYGSLNAAELAQIESARGGGRKTP